MRVLLSFILFLSVTFTAHAEVPQTAIYTATNPITEETHFEVWTYTSGVVSQKKITNSEPTTRIAYRENGCEVLIFWEKVPLHGVEQMDICPEELKHGQVSVGKMFFVNEKTKEKTEDNLLLVSAEVTDTFKKMTYQAFMTVEVLDEENKKMKLPLRTFSVKRYVKSYHLPEEESHQVFLNGELIKHTIFKKTTSLRNN